MASSTSSPADGSPRQLTDSSMALWATVPRAVCGVHANASSSWARKSPSQPCTELSRCFDTHSVSPVGHPLGHRGEAVARGPSRSSARSRGSNSGRSWGRAPSAASTSRLGSGFSSTSGDCHTRPELNGPVMQQSSSLRFARAVQALAAAARALGLRRARLPQPAPPRRRAALDQAVARRRHRGRRRARPALAGGAGRPRGGHRRRQRPRAAPPPTAPGPSSGWPWRAPRRRRRWSLRRDGYGRRDALLAPAPVARSPSMRSPSPVSYADVFIVLREGDDRPGPNDWEATVRTAGPPALPARHLRAARRHARRRLAQRPRGAALQRRPPAPLPWRRPPRRRRGRRSLIAHPPGWRNWWTRRA